MVDNKSYKIPILAYHNIVDKDNITDREIINSPFSIFKEEFRFQMRYLAENGYRSIDIKELIHIQVTNSDKPVDNQDKNILITFDDGYVDNYEFAFPILKEFNLKATFFVISKKMGSENFASWAELREMKQNGMDIESHTHTHVPLELLSEKDVIRELSKSKDTIEQNIGEPVSWLSFPHGSYTRKITDLTLNTGYQACGTSNFAYVSKSSKLKELPRIMLRKSHTLDEFKAICQAKNSLLFSQKVLYGTKNLVKNTIGLKNYMALHRIMYKTKKQVVRISENTN